MLETKLFSLSQQTLPNGSTYFYYQMHRVSEATQQDFDVLSQSLALICDNTNERNSIVLDCSQINQCEFISRFWTLSFGNALSITNKGLNKFVLISQSKLLKTLSKPIIAIKKASKYTFIVASLDAALAQL